MKNIDAVRDYLAGFSSIDLEEMDAVRLQNRLDTKFVLPADKLGTILESLVPHYRILEIAQDRLQSYQTLYFDTEDAAMYRMHHNGQGRRLKVRKRWYMGSDLAFFEIKRRTNKKRTIKTRRRLPDSSAPAQQDFAHWLQSNCPYHPADLRPLTWTGFRRLTLVNHALTERVTIDCGLSFLMAKPGEDELPPGDSSDWKIPYRDVCIVEIKQSGRQARPAAMDALRAHRVHPSSFSKYCIGTALLRPEFKQGCFRPLLRTIGALT